MFSGLPKSTEKEGVNIYKKDEIRKDTEKIQLRMVKFVW